ncbi:hypothetical protein DFH09DRAFT_1424918 [Mycena vulgaris]|nr:hypothetical protein DFH09DRAFT_1424918 [Mycena vulgaris]
MGDPIGLHHASVAVPSPICQLSSPLVSSGASSCSQCASPVLVPPPRAHPPTPPFAATLDRLADYESEPDQDDLPSKNANGKPVRRRSSKAYDQCRSCVLLGIECTFLGPSRKARLHQRDEGRAGGVLRDLSEDPLSRAASTTARTAPQAAAPPPPPCLQTIITTAITTRETAPHTAPLRLPPSPPMPPQRATARSMGGYRDYTVRRLPCFVSFLPSLVKSLGLSFFLFLPPSSPLLLRGGGVARRRCGSSATARMHCPLARWRDRRHVPIPHKAAHPLVHIVVAPPHSTSACPACGSACVSPNRVLAPGVRIVARRRVRARSRAAYAPHPRRIAPLPPAPPALPLSCSAPTQNAYTRGVHSPSHPRTSTYIRTYLLVLSAVRMSMPMPIHRFPFPSLPCAISDPRPES